MPPAYARFDDVVAGHALVFPTPARIVCAVTPDQVASAISEVDAATRDGMWAAGYVSYEAAAGLDPSLSVHAPATDGPPLVWFALSHAPHRTTVAAADDAAGDVGCGKRPEWTLQRTHPDYRAAFARVQQAIAAGDTYQVNLTGRLAAAFDGDPAKLYAALLARQRPAYAALIDTGRHVVVSASPELFFHWQGAELRTRPMKGTAARGRTLAEDEQARRVLLGSEKERAENVIIVDLLRNDLSRIADTGTVRVERIGHAERYETLWQLTSDISARVPVSTPLLDIFTALFPSGSVTGAPKPSTMRLIREVEQQPRGVYCGAIGWVAPPGGATRARFNVAIRTVVVAAATGRADYGVGGGITSGSLVDAEVGELWTKARILTDDHPDEEFLLVETAAYLPGVGVRHRDAHVARLAASARYFGFRCRREELLHRLGAVAGEHPLRVRLTLARDGAVNVDCQPMPEPAVEPVSLSIDLEPVDTSGPWLFHKTSRRATYTSRAERHDTDDVILVNVAGYATETTIANLAVLLEGRWWTPPVADGLLAGVERAALISDGRLTERSIPSQSLYTADGLAVLSSLRGWRRARLAR